MVTVDLAEITVREANERIRAAGEDVEVLNPDARHHIGVGVTDEITVRVRGSAGYFLAGLTDGPRFEVDNNVGWGLADNMYKGSVVVGGNAGAIAGVAIRGAEVVVRGNIGSRAGQVMKAGTLCCAGNANFMAGYMMYGGRIIILGDSGEKLGEDMSGGEIYLGGALVSLGSDAMVTDIAGAELDDIREFLDRYEVPFEGGFQKIVNAGKKLRYGTTEQQVRSIPFFTFSGASDYWNPKVQEDVYIKSQIGRYRVRGYGGARALPHLSDLAFRKDISRAHIAPDPVSRVRMRTLIGGKNGATPLDLTMPVMIAPMSYGALSRSVKQAIAIASSLAGIAENTGEGGMSDAQRDAADQLIFQCLGGRLGWNIHDMKRANGLEIYISQGAKPGFGGQLMAKKVTKELAEPFAASRRASTCARRRATRTSWAPTTWSSRSRSSARPPATGCRSASRWGPGASATTSRSPSRTASTSSSSTACRDRPGRAPPRSWNTSASRHFPASSRPSTPCMRSGAATTSRLCSWAASATASTPSRPCAWAPTPPPWARRPSSPAAASPACSATSASA